MQDKGHDVVKQKKQLIPGDRRRRRLSSPAVEAIFPVLSVIFGQLVRSGKNK
jgi:hypothetical protein